MNNFRTILLVCSLVASSLQAQSWLTNGLACYLPFSGDTTDVSGNGNDGVNNGALPVEDRFGRTNSAYHFDGTNNYIEIQDSSAFKSTNFTISMWFKPERYPNIAVQDQAADMLISKGQNNFEIHTGSEVTGEAAMKFLPRYAISNDFSTSPNSFIVGRWQHVVAIYEPSTNQIHVLINGVEQQLTGPATRPMGADNNLSLWIGKRRDNSLAFKGALDDVRIYNRALTTNEAMELYAIEAPAEIEVAKAVYLRSSTLKPGTNYQVQVSTDLTNWSNYGAAFTATNANWRTTNYIDVGDWDRLFFRLQQQ